MPGMFSPPPWVSDPSMHHGTCVTHVPWCMPESLTSGFLWSRVAGKTFPAFPPHAQPTILHIWQEVHEKRSYESHCCLPLSPINVAKHRVCCIVFSTVNLTTSTEGTVEHSRLPAYWTLNARPTCTLAWWTIKIKIKLSNNYCRLQCLRPNALVHRSCSNATMLQKLLCVENEHIFMCIYSTSSP